jgi:formylmethanofuran dehydrogenase subunit E
MSERPELHLVEDPRDPSVCTVCGEAATARSAVDGAPLCLNCFTETHWHPSWAKTYDEQ